MVGRNFGKLKWVVSDQSLLKMDLPKLSDPITYLIYLININACGY